MYGRVQSHQQQGEVLRCTQQPTGIICSLGAATATYLLNT